MKTRCERSGLAKKMLLDFYNKHKAHGLVQYPDPEETDRVCRYCYHMTRKTDIWCRPCNHLHEAIVHLRRWPKQTVFVENHDGSWYSKGKNTVIFIKRRKVRRRHFNTIGKAHRFIRQTFSKPTVMYSCPAR